MLGSRVNGSVDYECACAVNQMQMRAEQCGAGQDVGCACCPGRVMPLGWAHRASDRGLLGLILLQLPLPHRPVLLGPQLLRILHRQHGLHLLGLQSQVFAKYTP